MNMNQYPLIPAPAQLQPADGQFVLNAQSGLGVTDARLLPAAELFAAAIAPATGLRLDAQVQSNEGERGIVFVLDPSLPPEGYELQVTLAQVRIKAAAGAGAFYGMQTLLQLLPVEVFGREQTGQTQWSIPAVLIKDQPRFAYRGMHLDVSRHFFSLDFIKRYIDLIAAHKMNRFHWHLTDDQGWRIEIKKYPLLTQVGAWRSGTLTEHALNRDALIDNQRYGGFYTQDEIREVVRYAAQRYVTVIPELDIPGHSSALLAAYPQYACHDDRNNATRHFEVEPRFGIFPAVLCPREDTFAFLADVFAEVAALFPADYIHIGGDEVLKQQWQACDECRALMQREGLSDYEALHGYFVERVEAIVNDLGKQVIGWDEILDGNIAPSATVMSWRGVSTGVKAARAGHDVIMTPGVLYFDAYQSRSVDEPMAIHGLSPLRDVYQFEPVPDELSTDQQRHILGAQGNLWTEYVRNEAHAEYMILPRMSALAEVVWTPAELRAWPDFLRRLETHFQRLDAWGLNASRSVYKVEINTQLESDGTLRVSMDKAGSAHEIRYSLDGSLPDAQSPLYDEPLLLRQETRLRAIAYDPTSATSFGDSRLSFVAHKALAKRIRLNTPFDRGWNRNAERILLDGVLASDQIVQPPDWALFGQRGMDAVIDLETPTEISYVEIGFGVERHRRLYPPTAMEVMLSEDGDAWQSVARLDSAQLAQLSERAGVRFDARLARYVRVIAENTNEAVLGASAEPVPMPLLVDEIIIK